MIPVALFPIPDCVTFPGTVFPLHVFEPRYRQMVKDCVENNRLMGICHTESVISKADINNTVEEALSSNQSTYQPYLIFSAGKVVIETKLPDGRVLINVRLQERFRAINQIQSEPYGIYECVEYMDRDIRESVILIAEDMKEQILLKLKEATKNSQFGAFQSFDHWRFMDITDFSFQLFGILRTEGDILQQVLQCRSPLERLNIARQLLRIA